MTPTVPAPTELGDVEVHPAAEMFPLMRGAKFDELVVDIRGNGLDQPIVRTPGGAVLDGRNRLRACLAAGVEPRFAVSTEEPWRFVLSANLHRRELTRTERALIAAKLAERSAGRYGSGLTSSNGEVNQQPPTREQARQLLGVSEGSLDRAKRLLRDGSSSLKAAVETGKVSLAKAANVATTLALEEQDAYVAHIEVGGSPHRTPADVRPGPPAGSTITKREARYRYVQTPGLRLMADSFDGLATVLNSAEGLDPVITAEEAARWRSDLSRRSKSFRQLMALLKERSG